MKKVKIYMGTVLILLITVFKSFSESEIIPFHDLDLYTKANRLVSGLGTDDLLQKTLLVHTADRSNLTDAEKRYGWGKVDIEKAKNFIKNNKAGSIVKDVVSINKTHFLSYKKIGCEKIVATLSWDKNLSQDLDIRVINDGQVNFPLSLDDNGNVSVKRDNKYLTVERVDLTKKVKNEFTIQVTAKNKPKDDVPFILLVSGAEFTEKITERETRDAERNARAKEREQRYP